MLSRGEVVDLITSVAVFKKRKTNASQSDEEKSLGKCPKEE